MHSSSHPQRKKEGFCISLPEIGHPRGATGDPRGVVPLLQTSSFPAKICLLTQTKMQALRYAGTEQRSCFTCASIHRLARTNHCRQRLRKLTRAKCKDFVSCLNPSKTQRHPKSKKNTASTHWDSALLPCQVSPKKEKAVLPKKRRQNKVAQQEPSAIGAAEKPMVRVSKCVASKNIPHKYKKWKLGAFLLSLNFAHL